MISKYILGSAVTASLLLVGCGSDSSDTITSTLDSTTGYVVDTAVQNMDYDCIADNDMNKATGTDGAFTCQNMSQVQFRIGKMILGEISSLPSDGYVFPQDIVGVQRSEVANNTVTAMAQLLQSLDENDDLSDGIQITEEDKELLGNIDTVFTADSLNQYWENISINPAKIRTETEAQEHLRATMQTLNVNGGAGGSGFNLDDYSITTNISEELKATIAYMGNEERLAYDVYMNLYTFHMNNGEEIKQLFNIADKAESKHIEIVQSLVHRYNLDGATLVENPVADSTVTQDEMPSGQYGIPAIQALYDTLYAKGKLSKQDALEAGCMVEVTDINDLNNDIALASSEGADDIVAAYNVLRDGSYSHYWSFDKGLINMGITEGCCSLGADYCRPDYPQTDNGGNGQSNH